MKFHSTYNSSDGLTRIHAITWKPQGKVSAVVQISHGMCEFIDRYDEFANFLCDKGILVTGNDHLGHGQSVINKDRYGYFAKKDPNGCVIADIHRLRQKTQSDYPDVPYFMVGHSMGSYLLRQYIGMHGEGLAGAVIVGTGTEPAARMYLLRTLLRIIAPFNSWEKTNAFINKLGFGDNNARIDNPRTGADWLTKDEKIVDAYCANPLCNFSFTLNGYEGLGKTVIMCQKPSLVNKIPKDLPLLIISGDQDPVGAYGEGVKKAFELYQKAEIKDLKMTLYPGDRHEILNETDRDQIYKELFIWFTKHMK